jgi:hypothetical protein
MYLNIFSLLIIDFFYRVIKNPRRFFFKKWVYEILLGVLLNYLNRWHKIDFIELNFGARGKYRRHNTIQGQSAKTRIKDFSFNQVRSLPPFKLCHLIEQ